MDDEHEEDEATQDEVDVEQRRRWRRRRNTREGEVLEVRRVGQGIEGRADDEEDDEYD